MNPAAEEMESLISDIKILLQNFDLNKDAEPLEAAATLFDQMSPDIAEHEDILVLRVMIAFKLQWWAQARQHLIKLLQTDRENAGLYNDLANLNFKLDNYAAVVDNLGEYFRLAPMPPIHCPTMP
ncbi:MAG: hypothetical protein VCE74_01785 [Alphaproteobacteria bacterium]